jgi:RimJ/RimL family protein N-acetyltransferase
MSFVNRYQPSTEPQTDVDPWGPDPYDINYVLPIDPSRLENDLVKLTPFIPRVHAEIFWTHFVPVREDALRYIPWHLPEFTSFLHLLEYSIRRDPSYVLFAIIDKTRPSDAPGIAGAVAGIIGLYHTMPEELLAQLGSLITLPEFRRSHVTSNAVGLLLRYCLDSPSAQSPGLGLRRVELTVFEGNDASAKVACRMGFRLERFRRWRRTVSLGIGHAPREGDPMPGRAGVHTSLYALCWDDWEEHGVRERVFELMKPRESVPLAQVAEANDAPFVNLYQAPVQTPLTAENLYGPDPYDINFVYPINLAALENDVVKLVPFVPRVHAAAFWEQFAPSLEDTLRYFPRSFSSLEAFLAVLERNQRDPGRVPFAIIDKTRGDTLVGIMGLLRAMPHELKTEIGIAITLPAFRRTHVTANALGLLVRFCLNLPSASIPGLGLRRVSWGAYKDNVASTGTALRMGFRSEGIARWARMAAPGKVGETSRETDPMPDRPGWHTATFALCWDEWENGVRDKMEEVMGRRY